jgi:predicted exporter
VPRRNMSASSRVWVLVTWAAFIVVSAWIVFRADYRADISAFLPKNPTANQQLLVDQLKDGVVSRLTLIGIDGADAATLAQISKRMAAQLRADAQWATVNNGEAIALEQDGKFLLDNRYLLSDNNKAETWQVAGLKTALAESKQMLSQNAGMFAKELIPRDPTGEVMRMLDDLSSRNAVSTVGGAWVAQSEQNAPRAVLMAQTKAAGVDLDAQQRAMESAQLAFENAKRETKNAANASLQLSGPGVFSALSRERIKSDATRFSTIATALVVMLVWWVYRSPRVMALGLMPVATGVLAGIAAVALVFGSVHGITLGFGATLIGEAVDYAIYLFTLIRRDGTAQSNAHQTMKIIWPTLRLGVLTSICGFSAMMLSDFPGLQQLGVFSVAGLVAAVLVTRFVLPHLLPQDFQIRDTTLGQKLASLARAAPRARWPLTIAVLVLVAVGVMNRQTIWNDDISNLSPISLAEQKRDEALRTSLGAPDVRFMVVAESADLETTLQAAEKASALLIALRNQGLMKSFDTPTQFLPSAAAQSARKQTLPTSDMLRTRLNEAATDSGFSAGAFEPFLADVEASRSRAPVNRAALDGTNLATKVDALLIQKPERITAILPIQGMNESNEAQQKVRAAIAVLASSNIRLMDMKTETNELYQTYRHQALVYALAGVAAIALLLWLTTRSLARTGRLLLPLGAAVVVTAAILLALGVSLSIFHLVAFLLVIGVGSNYALFFDRQLTTDKSLAPIMLSLVVCNLSTVFGFGVLALSSMPVLKAIGGTVAIGAVLSLTFAAVYLQMSHRKNA